MQVHLNTDDSKNSGENNQYIHSTPFKIHKKKRPFVDRDKFQFTFLEDYKIKIDQGKCDLPLIQSNDRMSITAPDNIRIIPKKTYPQDWPAYNLAQTNEKIMFMELVYELVSNIPPQKYKGNGRPSSNIDEIIFCICLKQYLDFSSRRTKSDIRLSQQLGYIEHAPHFNTILKYLNNPLLYDLFKALVTVTALPLRAFEEQYAVDGSGFSTSKYEPWVREDSWDTKRRQFKKAHLFTGVKTNIIVGVDISYGYVNEAMVFPRLFKDVAHYFDIKGVMADMGYSSKEILGLISDNGSVPYIPFKKNSVKRVNGPPVWNTMYDYFTEHKEEFMKHYHLRSNAESVFSMMKRKQGCNLKTKNNIAQRNEIMCKCLVHNICVLIQEMFELGIKVNFKEVTSDELMCRLEI